MAHRFAAFVLIAVLVSACGGGGAPAGAADTAAAIDATADAPAALDAPAASDATSDATSDAGADTGADTGADAAPDTDLALCETAPDGASCDDGDPQSVGDRCLAGRCVPGPYRPVLGACGPARPIGCNAEVAETTAGASARVAEWPCGDSPLAGPERLFAFTAPYLVDVTAALVTDAPDLRLVVAWETAGGGCDPSLCTSVHPLGAAFRVSPGETVYLAVDGAAPEGAAFRLGLGCQGEPREIACGDGRDEDQDGATDCADPDCLDDPHCDGTAGTCEANYLTVCGLDETWSTGSVLAVNRNENYACSEGDFSGREYVYELRSPEAATATARLSAPDPYESVPTQQILVLDGACEPTACVGADPAEVTFDMEPRRPYYVVVDAERGFEGFFHLTVTCTGRN